MLGKLLILFLLSSTLLPLSANIEKESSLASSYRYMYHRTLGHKNELFFQGKYSFSNYFLMGTGFSTAFNALPERFYITAEINNLPSLLKYRIRFLSRNFPDYEIRENSIIPTIELSTRFFELELGLSFRFMEALGQNFSYHLQYRLQWNILIFKGYELSFRAGNFDLFRSDNITSLYYTLENRIMIGKKWIITLDIGIHDAGQTTLSSFFTSIYGEIGFKYCL